MKPGRRMRFGELMKEVPRALIVYKEGHCSCYESTEYYDDWLLRTGGGGSSLPAVPPERDGYILIENEVEGFVQLWHRYQSTGARKRRFIGLAAQRLERAAERLDNEDQLIEIMIAAEALFLAGLGRNIKYKGELPYQLAINAAFLLAQSEEERATIFEQLRSAYDLRSEVVRGGSPLLEAIEKIRENAESHVRRALHLLLERAAAQATGELIGWEQVVLSSS